MTSTTLSAFLRGLGLGASLIVAIGAQNAFVLRQGLRRRHVLATALVCSLCDALLIACGAGGMGALIARFPGLTKGAAVVGAAFLIVYGFRAFRSALRPATLDVESEAEAPASLRQTIVTALAFSLLNPHVYLDTVVLVGGLAGQYAPHLRLFFALGAMLASLLWFFGLAFGASRLTPLFRRPQAWRILDAIIGVTMWFIAISLLRGLRP